ncbi:MAG: type IV secretion system DNA-binding domain-containing protein [Candidatus Paceibacterota bacterium]
MQNPDRVTYFAATDSRGKRTPFGLKAKDRARHMYVIGKTGMGKSTLLENMAIQDIQNGEGMAFIDPHGSAVESLLEYIPEHRIKDVVYFAPFDLDQPMAFNIMEDVGYDKRHLVVSGLMATFKKIWLDAWSARMEYILTNTLLALLEYPDATLLGVNRMYTDKAYRNKVVENVKDPVVKDFWVKEFAAFGDKYTQEATPAIQNKIGQFTSNPLIRNIIGQPKSSFDIRELMDNKKILLINLSKGLVGDTNMRLLGSMLTTRIFLGAMSRAELAPRELDQAQDFYFYVDEFQNFANDTFAEILSEARKYHLNLIIAHQYVEQMEEQVRAAVFGNVGTTVSFRVGPFDAETLETIFMPEFVKEDLVNLGFAQIYLTLMIDGVGSRPFSAITLPRIEPPQKTYKQEVIEASRQQFGNKRAQIEETILNELSSTDGQSGPVEAPAKRPAAKRPITSGGGGTPAPRRDAPSREHSSQPHISGSSFNSEQRQAPARPREPLRAVLPRDNAHEHDRNRESQGPRREERSFNQPSHNSAPPPASKNSEDLKAILRGMAASATKEKEKKTEDKAAPLKGVLADVLKSADEKPAQPPRRENTPEATRPEPKSEAKPYEVDESTLRAIFNEKLG